MAREAKFFILVLYNCNIKDSDSYNTIVQSLADENEKAHLYIYDNSLEDQIINKDDSVWESVSYVHDSQNSGLGVAYNSGVKLATKKSLKWVVLLDQDTRFPVNFIMTLNQAIRQNDHIKLFAPMLKLKNGRAFSPTRYKYKVGHFVNLEEGILSLKEYSPVNSGMVINIAAFNDVGGYLENVKLDFSDFQFIERFRKKYLHFYLMDTVAVQNYSKGDKDLEKNLFRFAIYLECVRNCVRNSLIDDLLYLFIAFKHLVALCIKCQSLKFIKLFYFKYIKNTQML